MPPLLPMHPWFAHPWLQSHAFLCPCLQASLARDLSHRRRGGGGFVRGRFRFSVLVSKTSPRNFFCAVWGTSCSSCSLSGGGSRGLSRCCRPAVRLFVTSVHVARMGVESWSSSGMLVRPRTKKEVCRHCPLTKSPPPAGLYGLEFLQFKFCTKFLCAICSVLLRILHVHREIPSTVPCFS